MLQSDGNVSGTEEKVSGEALVYTVQCRSQFVSDFVSDTFAIYTSLQIV